MANKKKYHHQHVIRLAASALLIGIIASVVWSFFSYRQPQDSWTLSLLQLGLFVIHSMVISLLAFVLLKRALVAPLKHIIHQLNTLTSGHKITPPAASYLTETNELVDYINQLLGDAHARIENECKLRAATEVLSQKFQLIFDKANAGIGMLNHNQQIVLANSALQRLLQQDCQQPLLLADFSLYFAESEQVKAILNDIMQKSSNQFTSLDLQLNQEHHKDPCWVHCLVSCVNNDVTQPTEKLLQIMLYDVTERTERERRIIFDAEHDPLSLLLNRRAAMKKLQLRFYEQQNQPHYFALIMIDLDGFKHINDDYGHDAGDKIIIEISSRLKHFFRGSDVLARWGGDEFLIGVTYNPHYQTAVANIAAELQQQIKQPIAIGDGKLACVGSSVGISLYPNDDTHISGLIEKADHAMYHAKHQGKNRFHFYHDISI